MSTTLKGSLYIVLAATSYGLYGIYSRLIGQSFGEFSQSWTRNTIILIILGLFLIATKTWRKVERKDWKWMILWPLSDVVSIVFLYITFNLPVEVIFAAFFGFLFFQEMPLPRTLLGGFLIASAAILPHLNRSSGKMHNTEKSHG